MKSLPNYDFSQLTDYNQALNEIEKNVLLLKSAVAECGETLSETDRSQLILNIKWLRRYYEAAERSLLNDI